jgi:hypothetical protein
MVWFYERHGAYIRCETRDASDGSGFDLLILNPDGTEQVEHFDDDRSLTKRQQELETTLAVDGWMGPFGRTI